MNIPQSNTSYEPNSDLDMARRLVPIVDLTQHDEQTNSHVSDIPLQLSAIACVASNNSALVRTVPSLWQSHSPSQDAPSGFTSSSWTSRNCSIGYTTSTRTFECSGRNGSTCFASSTRIISCCHSSIPSGCEATLVSTLVGKNEAHN